MNRQLSKLLSDLSAYLAPRKGLLPIIGILLIVLNFFIAAAFPGWLAETNFFLHLGVIVAILGFMVAWAL